MDLFGSLISFLQSVWDDVKPVIFIREYQLAVMYKGGRFFKVLQPGVHFRIPFYYEYIDLYAQDDTIKTPTQMLTSKDGIGLSISSVVLYNVDDASLFINNVNDAKQPISDMAEVSVARNIVNTNFEECNNEILMNEVIKDLRRDCKKWGVYIKEVTINSLTKSKSINILKQAESHL